MFQFEIQSRRFASTKLSTGGYQLTMLAANRANSNCTCSGGAVVRRGSCRLLGLVNHQNDLLCNENIPGIFFFLKNVGNKQWRNLSSFQIEYFLN